MKRESTVRFLLPVFFALLLSLFLPGPVSPVEEAAALQISTLDFVDSGEIAGDRVVTRVTGGSTTGFLRYSIEMNGYPPFTLTTDWGDGTVEERTTNLYATFDEHFYDLDFACTSQEVTWSLTVEDAAGSSYTQSLPVILVGYTCSESSLTSDYAVFIENPVTLPTLLTRRRNNPINLWAFQVNNGSRALQRTTAATVEWRLRPNGPGDPYTNLQDAIIQTEHVNYPGEVRWEFTQATLPGSTPLGVGADVTVWINHTNPTIVRNATVTLNVVDTAQTATANVTMNPSSLTTTVGVPVSFNIEVENGANGFRVSPASSFTTGSTAIQIIPTNMVVTRMDFCGYFVSPEVADPDSVVSVCPGQTQTLSISVMPFDPGAFTITLEMQFSSLQATESATASVQLVVLEGGAILTTIGVTFLSVDPIMTVEFSGKVIALGTARYVDVWFQFRNTTGGEDWRSAPQSPKRVTQVQVFVEEVVQLDPSVNYTFEFVGRDSGGVVVFGGLVDFATPAIGGDPVGQPTNPFEGFLRAIGDTTGIPAEIVGFLLGMFLLIGMLLILSIFNIPWQILMVALIIGVVVNVLLFLWPAWVIILIAVFGGILLFRQFTEGGSE